MDYLRSLRKKKIAILGLGREGFSLINFFIRHQIFDITVCDKKSEKQLNLKQKQFKRPIKKRLGKDYLKDLKDFDIVFRSPGIPFSTPQIQDAYKLGVELSSATKLFFKLSPCEIVGITGTKGKGTTASLLFEMIKEQRKVYLGGNIGKPMLDLIEKLKPGDLVILELSSFQLQDLTVAPRYYVVLNIFCDHLDKHSSFQEYKEAKLHTIALQKKDDFAIIHESLVGEIKKPRSRLLLFGKDSDGLSAEIKNKQLKTSFPEKTNFELSRTKLLGEHNYQNIAAAALCALVLNISKKKIQDAIDNFVPLPHRLEFVGEFRGIKFYNDSQATIPESTVAAIRSFEEPKIVILGGRSKGPKFSEMAKKFNQERVRRVVVIGESRDEIVQALNRFAPRIEYNIAETLKEAVKLASGFANSGDVVLLSPSCASQDMFRDYKERGERFKEYVKKLKVKK